MLRGSHASSVEGVIRMMVIVQQEIKKVESEKQKSQIQHLFEDPDRKCFNNVLRLTSQFESFHTKEI